MIDTKKELGRLRQVLFLGACRGAYSRCTCQQAAGKADRDGSSDDVIETVRGIGLDINFKYCGYSFYHQQLIPAENVSDRGEWPHGHPYPAACVLPGISSAPAHRLQ